MSIASAIERATYKVYNCYDELNNLSATIPATQNLANMPASINSIPASVETLIYGADITDMLPVITSSSSVARPSSSNHDVVISIPINPQYQQFSTPLRNKFACGALRSITIYGGSSTNTSALSYAFYGMCKNCKHLISASFPDIKAAGGSTFYYAFAHGTSTLSLSMPNLTTVNGSQSFSYMFYQNTGVVNSTLNFLKQISDANQSSMCTYMCNGCTGLTNVELGFTNVSGSTALGYMFTNCTNLVSVDLSKLETVSGTQGFSSTFNGCSNLETVDFSNLTRFGNQGYNTFYLAFINCPKLTTVRFPALQEIGYASNNYANFKQAWYSSSSTAYNVSVYFPEVTTINQTNSTASNAMFYNCNRLTKIYLPKLTTFAGAGASVIFNNCTQLSEIHFGAANQAAIEASTGYASLWGRGAGAATVYFDL